MVPIILWAPLWAPKVCVLHSFICSYKMLRYVLIGFIHLLNPIKALTAGCQLQDTVTWSDKLLSIIPFHPNLQHHTIPPLSSNNFIAFPNYEDLSPLDWDCWFCQTGCCGCNPIHCQEFATAIKHFTPYMTLSNSKNYLLTDSKLCVTVFLSIINHQISLLHLAASTKLSLISLATIECTILQWYQTENACICVLKCIWPEK